jgi:hypothetical protein
MRKFEITNPDKFIGTAYLAYNDKETLCLIDCRKTEMDQDAVKSFKAAAPITLAELLNNKYTITGNQIFSASTTIIESGFVVSFDQFYNEYPVKRNRHRSKQLFEKLTGTEQVQAYYNLMKYKRYLQRKSWIECMHCDTFIRTKNFETDWNKI